MIEQATKRLDAPNELQSAISKYEVSPIIRRFGAWAVTSFGIECLVQYYPIELSRASEKDWISHMREKTWVNMPDFIGALNSARELLKSSEGLSLEGRSPLSVFLCHAKEDSLEVRSLRHKLIGIGVNPWMDEEDLLPGQEWKREITRQIPVSDIVLVCLSRKSVSKNGFVQNELKLALEAADSRPEGTIYVVPARLDDCGIPDSLSKFHWVDLFASDGFTKLCKSLKSSADSLRYV